MERLNRRPRVNKHSLRTLFPRRASLQTVIATGKSGLSSSPGSRGCSEDSSGSGSGSDGEGLLGHTEFIRNRKERSTVLVRRFYKNNQKVSADPSADVQNSIKMWNEHVELSLCCSSFYR